MTQITFETVKVGDQLPALTTDAISRTTLALFAGASGDHNPIHLDLDVARAAGMEDVFAQGMLPMAYLARLLTDWVPQQTIRAFSNRFAAITWVGEIITCTGEVTEKFEKDGENLIRLNLVAANEKGEVKLAGHALVALPKSKNSKGSK